MRAAGWLRAASGVAVANGVFIFGETADGVDGALSVVRHPASQAKHAIAAPPEADVVNLALLRHDVDGYRGENGNIRPHLFDRL